MNIQRYKRFITLGIVTLSVTSPVGAFAASTSRQDCRVPQTGLVSWWSGNGNARDRVGPNDGTIEGSTTFAKGKVGKAFEFVSESDDVVVTNSTILDTQNNSFSLVAWVKPTGKRPDTTPNGGLDTGDQTIVSKYQLVGATPATYIFRMGADGRLTFFIRTEFGQSQLLIGARDIADGKFHHVAAVRDIGAMTLNIYVDGALDATAPLTVVDAVSTSLAAFRIGNRFAPPFAQEHFAGLIDEVGYYSRALTQMDVGAINRAGKSGKCRADQRDDDMPSDE